METFNARNEPGKDEIAHNAFDNVNASILCDLRNAELPQGGQRPFEEITVVDTGRRQLSEPCYIPDNLWDLGWLGYYLGKNRWLGKLTINASSLTHLELNHIDAFFRLLARNRSIDGFGLVWMDAEHFDARIVESMSTFLRDNHNLVSLSLHNCELGVAGWRLVAQSLRDSPAKNLEYASFGASQQCVEICEERIDDESVAEIIRSLASYSSLWRLSIQYTRMAALGCTAIANLLDNSTCNIRTLELDRNEIDDASVDAMLSSLVKNRKQLRWYIDVDENPISDRKMLDLFSVYKHHKHPNIYNGRWQNEKLAELLARGDFGMEELYEYDAKLLSNLASIFDGASTDWQARHGAREAVANTYARQRLNVVFSFLRGMPTVGGSVDEEVAGKTARQFIP